MMGVEVFTGGGAGPGHVCGITGLVAVAARGLGPVATAPPATAEEKGAEAPACP